jgi:transposase
MLRSMLATEFSDDKTFTQIAREYHVSAAYAVGVFDSLHKKVERLGMPRVLCIDEFHFSSSSDQKYCCHLLDFETGMTVDIIKSRQKAYLREYFNAIPLGERRNVRWICTDMYDEYAAIKREFFPGAALVVDRFHVVEQLTGAVNVIRTRTMKTADKSSMEYSFMKSKWKVFLCLAARIPDRYVTFRKTGETAHYDEMVKRCIGLSEDLSQAWEALQSLLSHKCGEESFTDASKFVGFMSQKLLNCRSEDLKKVGATYRKWRAEIAMGICRNQEGLRLTNGRMEATNNVVKTVMKNAYGYRNFERFRKRSLLILWRKKRR